MLERGAVDAMAFRAALTAVAPLHRDAWLDEAFGLGPPPEDGPELPRGCVPYLPCPIDSLLGVVDRAPVGPSDLVVDVGSGLGRAAAVVSLLAGASVLGVEVQPALVGAARALAARLQLPRVSFVAGDATTLPELARAGSVFLLYCPFSGARLARLLTELEQVARTRPIRVCCVDLPLPPRLWLAPVSPSGGALEIYASVVA
jgi:SAM-dependent methyltransferase